MKIIDAIINLFFPKRCLFCNKVLGYLSRCTECNPEELRLPSCLLTKKREDSDMLNGISSLYSYDGCIRSCISRIKRHSDSNDGELLSILYADNFPDYLFDSIDCMLRVPDFSDKKYSLSENLLCAVAKKTGIPRADVMIKVKQTKKQHELELKERRVNLKAAFKCTNTSVVKGKNILIVDDVVTTGNTLNEIASVLKQCGANNVYGYTVASTDIGRKYNN